MTHQEYIEKKIKIMNETIVSIQRWSLVLFAVAIVSIVLAVVGVLDKAIAGEFLKYGISSITTLSGVALQGFKYQRKSKLLELEFSKNLIEKCDISTLQDLDKKIIEDSLFK